MKSEEKGKNIFALRITCLPAGTARYSILLLLLSAFLYFFKLGSFSLYDAAETTYGEFVKNMLQMGDWLTLHFNGQIIFDKPPLYYWLVAGLSQVVGFSEWTMRFWAALAGVLTVITTYVFGKELYNRRTGFLSAMIIMTAFQFLIQSRIAELDIVLTLFILLSLFLFYRGYTTGQRNYFLAAYLPMGLGMLIKGVLAAALPIFTIVLFLVIRNKTEKLREMRVIPGLIILTLIGLPWYLAEYILHGKVFLEFALGFLFISRFQHVVSGHTGPWYYYLPAVLLGFAPWSHFLPFSLWRNFKRWKNDPDLLLLCLIVPAFIVFSIAKTKIPNYILPLYPFLAISAGRLWDEFLFEPRTADGGFRYSNLFLAFIVALIIIGFIMVGQQNYPAQYSTMVPSLLALATVLVLGSILSILFFFFKAYRLSFASLPVMVFAIMLLLTLWALPLVEELKGEKPLGKMVTKIILDNQKIGVFDVGNRPGVVFYNSRPVLFLAAEKQCSDFLASKSGYLFTTVDKYEKIKSSLPKTVKILAKRGDLLVIYN